MWKHRLLTSWTYFRQAHHTYASVILSVINFVTIQSIFWSERGVASRWIVLFAGLYFPFAILLGRWDYKNGSKVRDLTIVAKTDPFNQDLAEALCYPDRANKLMKKWCKE